MNKNKVIVISLLLNLVLFGLFWSERSRRIEQEAQLAAEFASVQREVCTALKEYDYALFQPLAYRYQEISYIAAPEHAGWRAVNIFLDEGYYHAAQETRITVANMIIEADALPDDEKNLMIMNAVETANTMYLEYQKEMRLPE